MIKTVLAAIEKVYKEKTVVINCDPCCNADGKVEMLGPIPLTNIRLCTSWIEQASPKALAGTLFHESLHRYYWMRPNWLNDQEWYYAEGAWADLSGTSGPGVTPTWNEAKVTPDAYKCLLQQVWK